MIWLATLTCPQGYDCSYTLHTQPDAWYAGGFFFMVGAIAIALIAATVLTLYLRWEYRTNQERLK